MMTGQKLELILEFSVIILSPIVYHYYLCKYKKIELNEILKNAKFYVILYGLVGVGILILETR